MIVVWAPLRKERNQEQHALGGNTSPSAAGSPPQNVRQQVHLAKDDDLEPTLVLPATAPGAAADEPGRPHTDLEARLERLFVRGRELAGTLIRPEVDILEMGIVAASEAHRRHILTMVPHCHNRPTTLQLAMGALTVYNLRTSDYRPVGGTRTFGPTTVCFLPTMGCPGGPSKGVFSSSALRRVKAKMIALEGLFRELGAPRGVTILRRMVAIREPRGSGGRPRDGRSMVRTSPCVRHRHGASSPNGADDGQAPRGQYRW